MEGNTNKLSVHEDHFDDNTAQVNSLLAGGGDMQSMNKSTSQERQMQKESILTPSQSGDKDQNKSANTTFASTSRSSYSPIEILKNFVSLNKRGSMASEKYQRLKSSSTDSSFEKTGDPKDIAECYSDVFKTIDIDSKDHSCHALVEVKSDNFMMGKSTENDNLKVPGSRRKSIFHKFRGNGESSSSSEDENDGVLSCVTKKESLPLKTEQQSSPNGATDLDLIASTLESLNIRSVKKKMSKSKNNLSYVQKEPEIMGKNPHVKASDNYAFDSDKDEISHVPKLTYSDFSLPYKRHLETESSKQNDSISDIMESLNVKCGRSGKTSEYPGTSSNDPDKDKSHVKKLKNSELSLPYNRHLETESSKCNNSISDIMESLNIKCGTSSKTAKSLDIPVDEEPEYTAASPSKNSLANCNDSISDLMNVLSIKSGKKVKSLNSAQDTQILDVKEYCSEESKSNSNSTTLSIVSETMSCANQTFNQHDNHFQIEKNGIKISSNYSKAPEIPKNLNFNSCDRSNKDEQGISKEDTLSTNAEKFVKIESAPLIIENKDDSGVVLVVDIQKPCENDIAVRKSIALDPEFPIVNNDTTFVNVENKDESNESHIGSKENDIPNKTPNVHEFALISNNTEAQGEAISSQKTKELDDIGNSKKHSEISADMKGNLSDYEYQQCQKSLAIPNVAIGTSQGNQSEKSFEGTSPGNQSEKSFEEMLKINELLSQEKLLRKDKELFDKEKLAQNLDRNIQGMKYDIESTNRRIFEIEQALQQFENTAKEFSSECKSARVINDLKIEDLRSRNDQLNQDIIAAEQAFSDVFRKKERNIEVIEDMKIKEDRMREALEEKQRMLATAVERYEKLEIESQSKLENASRKLEERKNSKENEILRLQTLLKRAEMHVSSLEETVHQKSIENSSMNKWCDEMCRKMSK